MRIAALLAREELTKQERRLRLGLYVFAALSAAYIVGYLVGGIFDNEEFRFVTNSVAKDFLFVALALTAAANLRRYAWTVILIVAGHVVLILAQVVMLIVGDQPDVRMFGQEIAATTFMAGWIAGDVLVIAALSLLYRSAIRARHGLEYLSGSAFSTLAALAEVLVEGDEEAVPPEQVAHNVDGYLARVEAPGKKQIKLALFGLTVFPLLTLRPPFAAMNPEARERYLKRRFLRGVSERRALRPLRPLLQAMIRTGSQMTYIGYYGDERSHLTTGYRKFSERPGAAALLAQAEVSRPGVNSVPPGTARYVATEADDVVIGSGAAGSIVAYRLAEQGRRVLVLERGRHIEPSDFTEDEVEMYLRLYNEGALQLSKDFRFQVLQGMCVGGGTTVNNGVSLRPPEELIRRWNDELDAGLDEDALWSAFEDVEDWIGVQPQPDSAFSENANVFTTGISQLALPGELDVVPANIDGCLGSGYCNIGCRWGRKLSMLETVLPEGQQRFGDRLRVLPQTRVKGIETDGKRATAVDCEIAEHGEHRITADRVIVAAGAVGSSWLVDRSLRAPNAGRNLYFNMASPLTADFPRKLDSYAGMQISHYFKPEGGAGGFVLESWFNPVATQSLFMPGWFEEHFENMRRYDHMACAGTVVGTTKPARLKAARSGPRISYTPGREDLSRLVEGMKLMARAFLRAGAVRVMPSTYAFHEIWDEAQVDLLDTAIRDGADIALNTAHPQGGCAVSARAHNGVVDADFRVHGYENVHVCDASVFPSSITVNPQLTVMALAQYASQRIAA